MKKRKYTYYYVLQCNYGYGWDDVAFEDEHEINEYGTAWQRIKTNAKLYRENTKRPVRIINRRELKSC